MSSLVCLLQTLTVNMIGLLQFLVFVQPQTCIIALCLTFVKTETMQFSKVSKKMYTRRHREPEQTTLNPQTGMASER